MERIFLGFGFGAIQAGLFIKEARDSRNFSRIVVAETDPNIYRMCREAFINESGKALIRRMPRKPK